LMRFPTIEAALFRMSQNGQFPTLDMEEPAVAAPFCP